MELQAEYQQIQEQLFNIPQRLKVFFEAHYWGKFRLLAPFEELFPDPDGYLPLAQSQSPPYDTWLFLDPQREHILLRSGGENNFQIIASSLLEFLGSWEHWEKQLQGQPQDLYFDHRPSLHQLLPADAFLVTPFDDPEYFENATAYGELLEYCKQISGGRLVFDEVQCREVGREKEIHLRRDDQDWLIRLDKLLFDQSFIDQLNLILSESQGDERRLATSISAEMRLLLFYLSPTEHRELTRLGLLI